MKSKLPEPKCPCCGHPEHSTWNYCTEIVHVRGEDPRMDYDETCECTYRGAPKP